MVARPPAHRRKYSRGLRALSPDLTHLSPFPSIWEMLAKIRGMRLILTIGLAVILTGAAPPARAQFGGGPRLADGILAVVNDAIITSQQVNLGIAQDELFLREQYYRSQPEVYRNKLIDLRNNRIDNLIEKQIILHYFKTTATNVPESAIDEVVQDEIHDRYPDRVQLTKNLERDGITMEEFKKNLRDQIIVGEMARQFIPQPIISPVKVENYYLENRAKYKVEDEVRMRMIVLNKGPNETADATRKRGDEILSLLRRGTSFAELAVSYSEGSQRAEGGETGWMELSKLNNAILDAVNQLKPGETTGLVESPEACFLVLLEDRHAAHIKPLDEVRTEIEKTLKSVEMTRLRKQWIERLKAKTYIQYF